MSEVKWIKIATDIFDDEKIKLIRSMPEGESILIIWIQLMCLAGKINDKGSIYVGQNIHYTDEMLSTIFGHPIGIIRLALKTFENFDMIDIFENGVVQITNWEKYQNIEGMEKIREQTRKRVAKHREKQKELQGNVNVTLRNAIEREENKNKNKNIDKEREEDNINNNNNINNIKKYITEIEKIVGNFLSPHQIQQLMEHQQDTGQSWEIIVKAYEFVDINKKSKNLNYVLAILKNWYSEKKIVTLQDYEDSKKRQKKDRLPKNKYIEDKDILSDEEKKEKIKEYNNDVEDIFNKY